MFDPYIVRQIRQNNVTEGAHPPAAVPPTTDSLCGVRYQQTRERQPMRQIPLRESGCLLPRAKHVQSQSFVISLLPRNFLSLLQLVLRACVAALTSHPVLHHSAVYVWATTWQNQQNECAPNEDSDQPGQSPSLIKVVAVRSMGS